MTSLVAPLTLEGCTRSRIRPWVLLDTQSLMERAADTESLVGENCGGLKVCASYKKVVT